MGIASGAYSVGARVVVQRVTVEDVNGSRVRLSGRPACMPAPSTEWVICGPHVPRFTVDVAGIGASPPRPGSALDVYGTATAAGLRLDGYRVAR